jgi:hypothetical protein
MWRILLIPLLLAGCVQLPITQEDIQAKKFESVPDKAVIYIVRTAMDSREVGVISLDDFAQIATYGGSYYRWEVPPGVHRLAGFAGQSGQVELNAQPGQIYFVRHTVLGTPRSGVQYTDLRTIGEQEGRALVSKARL